MWKERKCSCKLHELLSNARSKRHGLLLITLLYDNNVKWEAIPGLSRDQFHMTRFGWTDRTGTNVTTTVKYKKMQMQSCYIHWILVIENLKRFLSLCQQLIKKLFLDGFHGYTSQMLNMNNYSGYKKLIVHVLHW